MFCLYSPLLLVCDWLRYFFHNLITKLTLAIGTPFFQCKVALILGILKILGPNTRRMTSRQRFDVIALVIWRQIEAAVI